MIAFFLLLVIVAIVLGIVGVTANGLLYLLFIGIAVLLAALIFAALRMRRRPGRRPPPSHLTCDFLAGSFRPAVRVGRSQARQRSKRVGS
jgi:membrane protein implicated in regulation of membrane protease activity